MNGHGDFREGEQGKALEEKCAEAEALQVKVGQLEGMLDNHAQLELEVAEVRAKLARSHHQENEKLQLENIEVSSMAGAGAGAEQVPQGSAGAGEDPEDVLVARLAALEQALAGEGTEVSEKRDALAGLRQLVTKAEAELAASEAQAARTGAEVVMVQRQLALHRGAQAAKQDPTWRDWAGLPMELLAKVAETLVAQNEAGWAAQLRQRSYSEGYIQKTMAKRKRKGNCLFVFARVCRGWRKAQLKVGGPLCTGAHSDVLMPGSGALAKWALAEGCPRYHTMATTAAWYGHLELVKWLCGEGGFEMDEGVMEHAACGSNLELVQWLRGEGCPWDWQTCEAAVQFGHVEVLRWVRENGCPWDAETRDKAAAELGYTEDFGNLV